MKDSPKTRSTTDRWAQAIDHDVHVHCASKPLKTVDSQELAKGLSFRAVAPTPSNSVAALFSIFMQTRLSSSIPNPKS